MKVQLPEPLKCLRCGYEWIPRIANVIVCARCKNPRWNLPKRKKKNDKPCSADQGNQME